MTCLAIVTEPTKMGIIASMARVAVVSNRVARTSLICVTGIACETDMSSRQWKARQDVMIELPRTPTRRVVAAVAFIAESTAMQVIIYVARTAVTVHIVKCSGRMTLLTSHVSVRADQGELCDVMVKPKLRNPARRNMTGLAAFSDLTKVHVIVGMAAAASSWQSRIEITCVAGNAFEVIVTGRQ